MLGEFAREDESDGGLDFAGRNGGTFVVGREFRSLASNTFEDVVDKLYEGLDGWGENDAFVRN
jgi:hypothetical protein